MLVEWYCAGQRGSSTALRLWTAEPDPAFDKAGNAHRRIDAGNVERRPREQQPMARRWRGVADGPAGRWPRSHPEPGRVTAHGGRRAIGRPAAQELVSESQAPSRKGCCCQRGATGKPHFSAGNEFLQSIRARARAREEGPPEFSAAYTRACEGRTGGPVSRKFQGVFLGFTRAHARGWHFQERTIQKRRPCEHSRSRNFRARSVQKRGSIRAGRRIVTSAEQCARPDAYLRGFAGP